MIETAKKLANIIDELTTRIDHLQDSGSIDVFAVSSLGQVIEELVPIQQVLDRMGK